MKRTPLDPWIKSKIGSRSDSLSRNEIEAYQKIKLRETLQLVKNKSRFYRRHLADVDCDLNDLEDLAKIPFTTADDIRRHPLDFLCVSQDAIQRVVTLQTSGTTGAPKRFYFTLQDQELTIDFFQVGMSTFAQPGDRVLILLPGERPGSVGDLLAKGLTRLGAQPIPHGPVVDLQEAMSSLYKEKVNCLVGVPTHVLSMARCEGVSGDGQQLQMRSVLLSTDYVPQAIQRVIEDSWGCQVYNHYGMTEMGLGVGVECEGHYGYHLREADLYIEVIDPQTGQPLPDGQTGEVVFTTLTRQGMPLVRYRTGDLSRYLPAACPCGTALKSLEWVKYRRTGSQLAGYPGECPIQISDLDEVLFPLEGLVNFLAQWTSDEDRSILALEIWMAGESSETTPAEIRAAVSALPAIQQASEERRIDFEIVIRKRGEYQMGSMAKRVLKD